MRRIWKWEEEVENKEDWTQGKEEMRRVKEV